jgi:hypothetical protein
MKQCVSDLIFQILMTVNMKIIVFCDVMLSSLALVYYEFHMILRKNGN